MITKTDKDGGPLYALNKDKTPPQESFELAKIAKGDHDAFSILVETLTPRLVAVASFYISGGAEDAVQEVWEKLWKYKESFLKVDNVVAWLVSVTKFHCVDDLRRNKRNIEKRAPLPYEEYVNVLTENDRDPESLYLKWESNCTVLRYVNEIKEIFGIPIKLFYYDGLSIRQIAEMLALTESAVKWRLYTGRQMIKKLIVKDGYYYGKKASCRDIK